MTVNETALVVKGAQGPLVGIYTRANAPPKVGVVIVAGQPQTRIGAHRMFVSLSRQLAGQGIATLRFDCGGWGDSPGDPLPFEHSAADIVVATLAMREQLGSSPKLVLLGLCDGASAAILSLGAIRSRGISVDAICLVNPWVRAERTHSEALLKNYYARRLLQPQMWRRLLTGKIPIADLLAPIRHWAALRTSPQGRSSTAPLPLDLPALLLRGLQRHRGQIWTILSGDDLTAAETESLLRGDVAWRTALEAPAGTSLLRIAGANHTLTDAGHWQRAVGWISDNCRML